MNGLKILQDARPNLLLAEIGALLHNLGKLSSHFVDVKGVNSEGKQPPYDYDYQMIVGIIGDYIGLDGALSGHFDEKYKRATDSSHHPKTTGLLNAGIKEWLKKTSIALPPPLNDRVYALADFIEFQDMAWFWREKGEPRGKQIFPNGLRAVALLERSHDAASGGEKEAGKKIPQFKGATHRASVFGIETPVDKSELDTLRSDVLKALQVYASSLGSPENIFLARLRWEEIGRHALRQGLGDTQRPINDVTAWDMAFSVAALLKAALAKALLQGTKWPPWTDSLFNNEWRYENGSSEARWRLLSIRFDGLEFLSRSHGIPDLIGRRTAFQAGLDAVRNLLEVTYPLGNEIYRDEYGSVFVVPDLAGDGVRGELLLGIPISGDGSPVLSDLITETFQNAQGQWLAGELTPIPTVSPDFIGTHLALGTVLNENPKPPLANPQVVESWWSPVTATEGKGKWHQGRIQDVCTVCGLRPQGYIQPDLPDYADDQEKAFRRNVCGVCLARRGRRAQQWATKELHTTIWTDEVGDEHRRLALIVGKIHLDDWLSIDMSKGASGEESPIGSLVQTMAGGFTEGTDSRPVSKPPSFARLRRVWKTTQEFWEKVRDIDIPEVVGKCPGRWRIIPDNRENIWRKSHQDLGKYHTYELVTEQGQLPVIWHPDKQFFLSGGDVSRFPRPTKGEMCELAEPTGYGNPTKTKGTIAVASVQDDTTDYVPTIPILAYPATFMQLVPADKALSVAAKIQTRYTREMGKVRNRLPLALGLVFFDVKTPLRAVLNAGRRMLQMPLGEEKWIVESNTEEEDSEGSLWQALSFGDEKPSWRIPVSMGDKSKDLWYPYYFLESEPEPIKRNWTFQYQYLDKRKETQKRDLVHITDLHQADRVAVTPALFDFIHLDVSARRFEVAYQHNGGKPERLDPQQRRRPYYLDQLEDLGDLWELLRKGLATKQISDILGLIETKRREWQEDAPAFNTFVEDTLGNAEWRGGWKGIKENDKQKLIRAAQSGMLHDVRELYIEVMKQKPEANQPIPANI
jgi:hypothetical protein